MTYKIERKRLKNSATNQSYCLTIYFQDGTKIQFPATNAQEALDYYHQFNSDNAIAYS
ncbi:MAG: hypothetical protein VKJ64_11445 [Leptolyngbyaceae bacterium]|nr:hypothetical protein [Leptolyngbyaceae bacterium]